MPRKNLICMSYVSEPSPCSRFGLAEWTDQVISRLPCLSVPQASLLALWTFAIVWAKSSSLTQITRFAASLLESAFDTERQRLREFYQDASQKSGQFRTEITPSTCFAHLLAWVLSLWQGSQIALGLDATSLGDRFVVLAISVLYRGSAIPICWTVLPGNKKGQWRDHWLRMIGLVHQAMPSQMQVLVMADRGLYARWLYKRICDCGWHPLLRINTRCHFRPAQRTTFVGLSALVAAPGQSWTGTGEAFASKGSRLSCTLVACWEPEHSEAWFLLTDLPADVAQASWYGMRCWIEHGFKFLKSSGWQWHKSRIEDPRRAERVWLALSVATICVAAAGTEHEDQALPYLPPKSTSKRRRNTEWRTTALFSIGIQAIVTAAIKRKPLPVGYLRPDQWLKNRQPNNKEPDNLPH